MSFLFDGNREFPFPIHIEKTNYDVEFFIDLFKLVGHSVKLPYMFCLIHISITPAVMFSVVLPALRALAEELIPHKTVEQS
jgi:hypothetical protein